jgi:hypothetical protein
MSEIQSQSKKSKGGARPGAGRKPRNLKTLAKKLPKESAEVILAEIKANQKWVKLADAPDLRLQFEVLRYLTDRAFGKAKQAIEHTGENGGPVQSRILVEFV